MRLLDQNGDTVSLWQFTGNVVLLDFSTMWCAPCMDLAGQVDDLMVKFEDDGFIYLTVLSQDSLSDLPEPANLNEWAETFSISAPVLSDVGGYTSEVMSDGTTYPRVLLVGRDMEILADSAYPPGESLEDLIRSAL